MTDFTRASSAEQPTGHSMLCAAQSALGVPEHRMHYWEWIPQSGRPAQQIVFCVHGLSRQGLDFSALADYLTAQHDVLVIAPDVPGRGYSDWLANPSHYHAGVYAADMLQLIAQVQAALPQPLPLTWLGTSMGGLIAMAALATKAQVCDKLILNDVAPSLEWAALARIGEYIGAHPHFASQQEGLDYCKALSASFGQLSDAQWLRLNTPQLRQRCMGEDCDLARPWHLHYDPKIAVLAQALTPELLAQQTPLAWALYDSLKQPTLLLRGAESDLISAQTAAAMQQRGPKAQVLTVPHCGHAPALQDRAQIQAIEQFLLKA
jgi:pimeloyl-ACP methyl ester carboxylesterase